MNIQNDLQGLQQILGGSDLSGGKAAGAQSTGSVTDANDQAHLSAAARLVSQAVSLPEIDTQKVAAVQAALADGSYQMSSSNVAAKLIDHMRLNQKF
ncbi:MAG TPA: flagellar biosynthesis anti-sigma factor FlgM [Silvibacterium sp.]|nr:flagellar biosynthesis anti-sigma factor FlgM [Silvibacterium sp.]